MSTSDEGRRGGSPPVVLFTDLDGTLLDPDDYSFTDSIVAVKELKRRGVPIVFCSSKTRAEQEVYRERMGIGDPFVVEDGSAAFIPDGYFSAALEGSKSRGTYRVVELGASYEEARRVASALEVEFGAKAYGSMSSGEVAELTGLSPEMAALAKAREYSETVAIDGEHVPAAMDLVRRSGLTATFGGRFHTIKGDTDKGKAVRVLAGLYEEEFGAVRSVGVGDSRNDIPLLRAVDEPYLVVRGGAGVSPGDCDARPVGSFREAAEAIESDGLGAAASDAQKPTRE